METSVGDCQVCGRYIPPEDFEERRAVVLLKKRYCSICTNAITGGKSASTSPSSVLLVLNQIATLFTHGRKHR